MIPSRPIVVTGADGLLGSEVVNRLNELDLPALAWTRRHADLSRPDTITALLEHAAPAGVIHCAAWTDVDAAESEIQACRTVNVDSSAAIARVCSALTIPIVFVSSGGVFDGNKPSPYDEYDEPAPRTVYHQSKRDGEIAVQSECSTAIVARVGWLYGGAMSQRRNFVAARLREASGKEVIRSSGEQFGTPTWTRHAAVRLVELLLSRRSGLVHIAPAGPMASRYDFVTSIIRALRLPTRVELSEPNAFVRKADVPMNEAIISAVSTEWGFGSLPDWREALDNYCQLLGTGEWRR